MSSNYWRVIEGTEQRDIDPQRPMSEAHVYVRCLFGVIL